MKERSQVLMAANMKMAVFWVVDHHPNVEGSKHL
jgi:hypothetical protein